MAKSNVVSGSKPNSILHVFFYNIIKYSNQQMIHHSDNVKIQDNN